ncbi:dephospho-CoA kinase [soil metagenome]
MLLVGITGGIGSGKTTVCKIFEVLGIPVYYADDRAKYLMHHNLELVAALKEAFGEEIYQNGMLDRALLSSKVFNNTGLLEKLNSLVHPAVAEDSINWQMEHLDAPYTMREAALLFEAGSYKALNKIVVVTAPKDVRIARVMARDAITTEQVEARINNQWPEEEKVSLADYVIFNDGVQEIIPQILAVHAELMELAVRG